MANKTVITLLLIALFFIVTVAAAFSYYNVLVNRQNQKISSLTAQAALQQKEITSLTGKIQSYNDGEANLTSHVTVTQASGTTNPLCLNLTAHGSYVSNYYSFFIMGSVANTGNMTAYNAGLQVTAYSASGSLEINMTVPLVTASEDPNNVFSVVAFGIDNQTKQFASTLNSNNSLNGTPPQSTSLGKLGGATQVPVDINILHEAPVAKWTITPIWSDTS